MIFPLSNLVVNCWASVPLNAWPELLVVTMNGILSNSGPFKTGLLISVAFSLRKALVCLITPDSLCVHASPTDWQLSLCCSEYCSVV